MHGHLLVSNALYRFPVVVSPRLSCSDALEISDATGEHFLLAVDDGRLIGMARACDLRKVEHASCRVVDSLRVPVLTVKEHDPIALAQRLLTQINGGCLVVLDDVGAVCGVVTCEDLGRVGALSLPTSARHCATCGAPQHLIFRDPDEPPLCCKCLG